MDDTGACLLAYMCYIIDGGEYMLHIYIRTDFFLPSFPSSLPPSSLPPSKPHHQKSKEKSIDRSILQQYRALYLPIPYFLYPIPNRRAVVYLTLPYLSLFRNCERRKERKSGARGLRYDVM